MIKNDLSLEALFPEEYRLFNNLGKNDQYPWHEEGPNLKVIIEKWEKLAEEINSYFKLRQNKQTDVLMMKGIALFLQLLFWSNHEPVVLLNFEENLSKLEIKPANLVDRISFIISRPTLHHSYIQLSELFIEQQKVYARYQVLKRRASHH